ncbi:ABC transporter ATP-binding protein [Micromonospora sp. NPDC023956]|uniref:ABC transporter ATP-binding protein n=1 Tax=Micromonospora sp. NPDC023956 TaxID=3155722 RepID=UPI0033C65907
MRLENVSVRYHRRGPWVLRQADARVGPGEVAVVLGRNGAGKSTLLQVAAGVLRATRGRVVDRPRHVGWVPERFPADQPFTVSYYLTAMARVAGLSATEADRAVDEWTSRLGIAGFRRVRLPDLSKGTAQKVGLAQAMLRRPGLLVLDEPWEGLDAAARDLVPLVVDEVLAAGGRVLVSDHRNETVRLPGARHWTVADGTVTEAGPAESEGVAVVEVAVPAARVAGTVARLRAAGHQVLRVRTPEPDTAPDPGPTGHGVAPDDGPASDPGPTGDGVAPDDGGSRPDTGAVDEPGTGAGAAPRQPVADGTVLPDGAAR